MEVKQRKSNFELMRIVSMFMIVLWHVALFGINFGAGTPKVKFIIWLLEALCVVHVNSFVLVSGYFQCKSKFRLTKFISLNNSVWFYKSVEAIIFILLGVVQFSFPLLIREFFPLDLDSYWYIRTYLLLYILSPFLNIFINSIDQNQHKKLLIVLFILFSITSTFTNGDALYQATNRGYSLINFIFLYFIGAYLRLYPIDKTNFGKKYTPKMKKYLFLFLYIFFALVNFGFYNISHVLLNGGDTAKYIGNILYNGFLAYDNPIVIIQSICYFMFFYYMDFHNKFINFISSTTFGIYLIHEYHFFRTYGYNLIFHTSKIIPLGYSSIIKCFIISIIIFVGGSIIEMLRKLLFKFIYNRKFSCKFRKWYRSYFESLGLNIPW